MVAASLRHTPGRNGIVYGDRSLSENFIRMTFEKLTTAIAVPIR
jgi:hypothetical protein